jgi:hypothetical protein
VRKAIPDHITVFSPSQVALMLEALHEIEGYFDYVTHPVPNVDFAKDTAFLLRGKLQGMVRERNYSNSFGMDANEVLLLHTALMLLLLTLRNAGSSEEQRHRKSDCLALIGHFAHMLKQV